MELEISQVAYSKLEKNETKSTVKRLFKLATIFEVDVGQLLGFKANSKDIFINPEDSTSSYYYNAEIYREIRLQHEKIIQLHEARLQDKEKLILQLEKMLK